MRKTLLSIFVATIILHAPTSAYLNENVDPDAANVYARKLNAVAGETLDLGINVADLPPSVQAKLPSVKNVNDLYGSEPVILGLDRCEAFREAYAPEDRFIAMAGLYNTGTNLLSITLRENCDIPAREESYAKYGRRGEFAGGILSTVHWGKHGPPSLQSSPHHILPKYEGLMDYTKYDSMPIVIVKDPIFWMASMCKRWYDVASLGGGQKLYERCPYLALDEKGTPIPVRGSLAPWGDEFEYSSLVDMWNEFYQAYVDYDKPRLIIRYEDLLFHGEAVTKQICSCAGGTVKKFAPLETSTKIKLPDKDGQAHGWIDSAILYGSPDERNEIFKFDRDRVFAETHLDDGLMNLLHYQLPSNATTGEDQTNQEEIEPKTNQAEMPQQTKLVDIPHQTSQVETPYQTNQVEIPPQTNQVEIPHILWFVAPKDTLTEMYFHSVVATINAYKEHWNEPDAEVHILSQEDCLTLVSNVMPELQDVFSSDEDAARREDVCQLAALYEHGGYAFAVHVETMKLFEPEEGVPFVSSVACNEKQNQLPSSCRMSTNFKASAPEHKLVKLALDAYAVTYQESELWDPATQVQLEMARVYQVELWEQVQQEEFPLVEVPLDDSTSVEFNGADTKKRLLYRKPEKPKNIKCNLVVRNTKSPSEEYFVVHEARTDRCGEEKGIDLLQAKRGRRRFYLFVL